MKIRASARIGNVKSAFIKLTTFCTVIVFSFFIAGCATKKDRDFVEINADKIEESLGVDKETLDKFRVAVVEPLDNKIPISSSPSKSAPKQEEKKQRIKVSPAKSKEQVSLLKKKQKEMIVPSAMAEPSNLTPKEYPKDFPKNLKDYDLKSKEVWPKFTPLVFPGEKFTFRIGYLGLTAGHIKIETLPIVKIGGKEAFHFKAQMRSARYYSYIYSIDDSVESYVHTDGFMPLKYVLLQRESAQTVDDLQLFDSEKLKTYHFYKRFKKGKHKNVELEKPIPRFFQDSFSALFFVRGLPLVKGDLYEFPVVTRGKIWIIKMKSDGIESLKVRGKWIDAIRVDAETRFPGVLEKKGDIRFWYSNDKKRRLLKFQADVKIGSIKGDLVEYQAK